MRVIFLSKDGEIRSVDTESKLCAFVSRGKTKVARLRCPATYVARLVEGGWKIESIESEENAGA